jgi:hypothetical protein
VNHYRYGTADWLGGTWAERPPERAITPGGVRHADWKGRATDGDTQVVKRLREVRLCLVCDETIRRGVSVTVHDECARLEAKRRRVVEPRGVAHEAKQRAAHAAKREATKDTGAKAPRVPPRPLTESERTALCACGHARGVHRGKCGAKWPNRCGCKGFAAKRGSK